MVRGVDAIRYAMVSTLACKARPHFLAQIKTKHCLSILSQMTPMDRLAWWKMQIMILSRFAAAHTTRHYVHIYQSLVALV